MNDKRDNALFGAAILKLSFQLKKITDDPGFMSVYSAILLEFKLRDKDVQHFIKAHRKELEEKINAGKP